MDFSPLEIDYSTYSKLFHISRSVLTCSEHANYTHVWWDVHFECAHAEVLVLIIPMYLSFSNGVRLKRHYSV
jgi:hypothetical protein